MSRNVLYLCLAKKELRIEEIEAENRIYVTITLTIFIAGIKEEWKGIPRNLRDMPLLNVHFATPYIFIELADHLQAIHKFSHNTKSPTWETLASRRKGMEGHR
jgi:hypothetical protein